jgi:hydrogenase/urease accessory protein HupE
LQTVELPAIEAIGIVLSTFTTTLDVAIQPLLPVTVTVYVVVIVGLAVGMASVVELNPADGLQLYVLPKIAVVPIIALVVVQFKICVEPASAVGGVVFTFTITISVTVQLLLPVTVTV